MSKFLDETGLAYFWGKIKDYISSHGAGLPNGGTAGQYLKKNSSTDQDAGWANFPTIPSKVSDLTNDSNFITGMEILSYGNSTWNDFITAYNAKKVVYCRASSNSNPASGSQTRLAFMAYVNDASSPTNVEFQYYRSVNSHSDSQQGDQVYVYKLTSAGTWTVTVRENYTKIVAGTGLSGSYNSGVLTLTNDVDAATATPENLGTAAVGSSSKFAREDHVHNMPTASDIGALPDTYTPPTEVFYAIYGTTTYAEVEAAYNAGMTVFLEKSNNFYPMTSKTSTSFQFLFIDSYGTGRISWWTLTSSGWSGGNGTQFVRQNRKINNKDLSTDITLDASDIGLENVDNVRQYSASNPPPDEVYIGSSAPSGSSERLWIDTNNPSIASTIFDAIYPVGSIYMSVNSVSPATLFGGTWQQIQDRFLLSAGSTYTAGDTGGEAEHILTLNESPAHAHTRGTMDITGMIRCGSEFDKGNSNYDVSGVSGAFYFRTGTDTEWGSTTSASSGTADAVRNVNFRASKSWTGETDSKGGSQAHNNMPPYLVVYMWKRIA